MVDEKRCYLFGRNAQLNDFTVDHGSCSRVHAALVYHKHLGRTFLVDCGSTHGKEIYKNKKKIIDKGVKLMWFFVEDLTSVSHILL